MRDLVEQATVILELAGSARSHLVNRNVRDAAIALGDLKKQVDDLHAASIRGSNKKYIRSGKMMKTIYAMRCP